MSAAHPGQGGDGHFNEQAESYLVEKFKKFGYVYNQIKTAELRKINEKYSQNMLVFERRRVL